MIQRISIVVLMGVLVGVIGAVAASDEAVEKAAVTAAQSWLELVDSGEYAESWSEAASYFRNAVAKSTWEQQMVGVRKPLGRTISRKVKSTRYAASLPGAPDGEYVIIQMDTSFENKRSAVETITPMLDEDSKWRVAGYFIK